jgi:hypothetical protein
MLVASLYAEELNSPFIPHMFGAGGVGESSSSRQTAELRHQTRQRRTRLATKQLQQNHHFSSLVL